MADYYSRAVVDLDVLTPSNVQEALNIWEVGTYVDVDGSSLPYREHFAVAQADDTRTSIRIAGSGGNFDIGVLVPFVFECASRFGLTGMWGFEYANTCSTRCPGAFGGGAVVIDLGGDPAAANSVSYMSTNMWLTERLAAPES